MDKNNKWTGITEDNSKIKLTEEEVDNLDIYASWLETEETKKMIEDGVESLRPLLEINGLFGDEIQIQRLKQGKGVFIDYENGKPKLSSSPSSADSLFMETDIINCIKAGVIKIKKRYINKDGSLKFKIGE